MNAWNANDLVTFLEIARAFGFTIDGGKEQSVLRVMSLSTHKVFGVEFDRTNGSVLSVEGDTVNDLKRTPIPTQSPAAWYAAIGITCDAAPIAMRLLPDQYNCQMCATIGGHLKDGPHTFAGNCQRRRATPG